MRALVAYYSRTGNNEKLVNELQAKLACDIEKIVDTANRKGIWGYLNGGRQAYMKRMSKIEPVHKDPSNYDLVILAYPLWSSRMPPAIRSYIFENKSKFNRVAFMSVSVSGEGNKNTIPDFETAVGKKPSAILMLKEADLRPSGYEKRLQEFSESLLRLIQS